MRVTQRFRHVAGTRPTWFSSSLILAGVALNGLAILTLLSSITDPGLPAPPGTGTGSASAVMTVTHSPPGVADHKRSHTQDHVEQPTAIPQAPDRKLYPAHNYLSPGPVPETPERRYSAGILSSETDAEEPETVVPGPEPTATPISSMPPATHVAVPDVGIDTNVVEVTSKKNVFNGQAVFTWSVADWAASHHDTSANPGENGNVVLTGHDDVRGEVFRGLHDIELGDQVFVTSDAGLFAYVVTEIHVREYRHASIEEQVAAGRFLAPMTEERVTLVTCWPYGIDTHRIVVVAKPL